MMPGSHHKYSSVPGNSSLEDLDDIALHSPRSESCETTEGDKEKGNCNQFKNEEKNCSRGIIDHYILSVSFSRAAVG